MSSFALRHLALALLAGFWATPLSAGFLNNKAAWDEVSPAMRTGYAMGAWDETITLATEAVGLNAYLIDLNTCVGELELNALHFVEIIDLEYQDVSNWQFPPNVVLSSGLRKACLDRINSYRAQRGEAPYN